MMNPQSRASEMDMAIYILLSQDTGTNHVPKRQLAFNLGHSIRKNVIENSR